MSSWIALLPLLPPPLLFLSSSSSFPTKHSVLSLALSSAARSSASPSLCINLLLHTTLFSHSPSCSHIGIGLRRNRFVLVSEGSKACCSSSHDSPATGGALLEQLLERYDCSTAAAAQLEILPSSSGCVSVDDGGSFNPDLLQQQITQLGSEQNLVAIVVVLESIGLSKIKVLSMYKHHEQLFLTTPAADLISRISLLEEFGMDRGAIAEAVQHCLPLLFFDIQEKLQPLLLLLETLGINKSPFVGKLIKYNPHKVITSAEPSIRRFLDFCSDYSVSLEQGSLCIRKYPLIVIFSSDNMYRLVDFLGEFNLEKAEIGMLVRRDPRLLTRNVEKSMRPTVEFLMELGVDRDGIATIIKKQPNLFGFSVQLSLKPKIEYLQDVGFGGTDLAKLLTVEPAVLTRSITDCLDSKVRVLQGLGFEMGSLILGRALSFAYSTSIDYLEDRVKWFLSHGFSRKETFLILRCNPCLLRSKTTQLQKKVDYLVNTMQYPMKDVVIYPQFLSLSLENRIIPRYRVMVWLKTVGLLNRNLSLSFFTRLTDEKFRRKYVDCYPGCCTAFETNEGSISH